MTAIKAQITDANIVAVLAGGVGAAIGFVLLWFGIRKVVRMVMGAFRKGRLSA